MLTAPALTGEPMGEKIMLKHVSAAVALAVAFVLAGSAAAVAQGAPELTAEPASITVGEETTVTATGLGGLETAYFGLDGTPGGTLIEPTTDQQVTTYDAPVENGQAIVRFTATQPGTFTVAVGTGETVAATTTVTVTAAASPTPTPVPTVTVTVNPPSPEPTMTTQGGVATDAGLPLWALILIIALAVLVVAAVITIVVIVARRGRTGPPTA
jgi:hypothetical protein